jgi:purine-binding chemotaxis protein CheW
MIGNPDFLAGIDSAQASEFQELETPEGELFLRFHIPSGSEFALPAIGVKEVIAPPPDRIALIPNVSTLLLGTINLRGRVVWVADLGQFLGDNIPLNTDRREIPVIAVEDQDTILGLAIDKLNEEKGIDWLDINQARTPIDVPDSMAQFIQREWSLDPETNRVLRLLNPVEIIRSARGAA